MDERDEIRREDRHPLEVVETYRHPLPRHLPGEKILTYRRPLPGAEASPSAGLVFCPGETADPGAEDLPDMLWSSSGPGRGLLVSGELGNAC